jgi:hypothetical protein
VREVQRAATVGENGERRRADGMLGNVEDLALLEVEVLYKAVQFAGGDALRSRFVHLLDEREQRPHA